MMSILVYRISKIGVLSLSFFLFLQLSAIAQENQHYGADEFKARFEGKTKPLRDLVVKPGTSKSKQKAAKSNKPKILPPNFIGFRRPEKMNDAALPVGPDPVLQNTTRFLSSLVEPKVVIEGIRENDSNAGVPDTNGEAGPNHFIQIINASFFQIFSKDGTAQTEPTSANTIWNQINKSSFSDPVVQYDEAADRWLLTDLAATNEVLYGVSETSDPLGSWYLYSQITPGFADYPKYGIWPNAYLLSINEGSGDFPVYMLNRQQMLAGAETVDIQRIDIPGINGAFPTVTPMDWNSPIAPPSDEVYVVRMNDDSWNNGNEDQVEVWKINIDWDDSNNTTFDVDNVPVSAFDSDGCTLNGGFQCIPQQGTNQGIDGIMTIVMNNVAYWNFGTHASAVVTFSVDATGGNISGIRWMELRKLAEGEWTLYQEGTYAPDDGLHRFIPSIAINSNGDIGLAYSVSGESIYPSLRYTGRSGSDPLGMMTVEEYEFATGLSSRSGDRYGDYAKMSIDPVDDSFWFTSEYMLSDGEYGTKIVNYEIFKDTFDLASLRLDTPVNGPDLSIDEAVTMTIRNAGLEPATGISLGFIFELEDAIIENATIDTLFADSLYTHTFASTVDMSTIGSYNFKIFTNFDKDQRRRNDTLQLIRAKLPKIDAGVIGVNGIESSQCDTFANADIILQNFGTDTLTSASILYSLNGGEVITNDWAGILEPGRTTTLTVDIGHFQFGSNELNMWTTNPNGQMDQITLNDSFLFSFTTIEDPVVVKLIFNTDGFPEENTWIIMNDAGEIIFSGDLGREPRSTVSYELCLEEDQCYDFTLFDSYGDGLVDGQTVGDYQIEYEDGTVIASILLPFFGYEEVNSFCLNEPCNFEAIADVTDAINGDLGAILISVSSGAGPFQYSIDNGQTFQDDPLFGELEANTYQLLVVDANMCTWMQEITVNRIVSTTQIGSEKIHISISPNPSKDGLFMLKVDGFDADYNAIEYQVVASNGENLMYGKLPKVNDIYGGVISLYSLPSGVYFIRIRNNKINKLIKVIKL